MTDNNVVLEKRGSAFWITINRPEKRNAINGDVVSGIAKGYRDAHDDPDVRVIVLTGAGAERHKTFDRAGQRRLHGRRHGAVVHDRHGGGG
jgi:enoyl-CoA hydratase/carnithine racemase